MELQRTMTETFAEARTGGVDDADVGIDSAVGPRADRPRRRSFTPEYKSAIVAEYDALTEAGARGALLRREGLYLVAYRGVATGARRGRVGWAGPVRRA